VFERTSSSETPACDRCRNDYILFLLLFTAIRKILTKISDEILLENT